jgi:hypothetical protein
MLPISLVHTLQAGGYNQPHRDPFDRMLAAQAELDDLVLLSADRMLASVPCKILWFRAAKQWKLYRSAAHPNFKDRFTQRLATRRDLMQL